MKKSFPKLSVVGPVALGADEFRVQSEAFARQNYPEAVELIYIDSREDKSRSLDAAEGAVIIPVEKANFRHGRSRNLGVERAAGEIVAFLSEDAIPVGAMYFKRLAQALVEAGAAYAGVSARQIPHSGRYMFSRYTVLKSPYCNPEPIVGLPLNNIASAVWRRVLAATPFEDGAIFGEDALFSEAVAHKGLKTGFAPRAVVTHSHERSAEHIFWRYYADAYLWEEEGGAKNPAGEIRGLTPPGFLSILTTSKIPCISIFEFALKIAAAAAGSAAAKRDYLNGVKPRSKGKV